MRWCLVLVSALVVLDVVCWLTNSKRILTANSLNFNSLSFNAITLNALTVNSLTYNSLTYNALTSNALSFNGIQLNGLGVIGQNGLYTAIDVLNGTILLGTEQNASTVAEFFKYFIQCALDSGDSWQLTLNGTQYIFDGGVGLVPDLKDRAITFDESRWLSACLFAHVNAFGIHVMISTRSGNEIAVTPDELAQYRVYEGAFFGDLSSNSSWYSCHGEPIAEAESESSWRKYRVCTDSTVCGFNSVGRCADVCKVNDGQLGYQNCTGNGTIYYEVVNTYLQSDVSSQGIAFYPVQLVLALLMFICFH